MTQLEVELNKLGCSAGEGEIVGGRWTGEGRNQHTVQEDDRLRLYVEECGRLGEVRKRVSKSMRMSKHSVKNETQISWSEMHAAWQIQLPAVSRAQRNAYTMHSRSRAVV